MRISALILFASTLPIFGQAVTAGVTGGIPVTDTFDSVPPGSGSLWAKTVRYSIGPSVDIRVAGPFRLEFDALYQPFSFHEAGPFSIGFVSYTAGSLWQFPTLLKYRVPTPKLKPFVDAGPSVRVAARVNQVATYYGVPNVPPQVSTTRLAANSVGGLALGAGVDFRLGPLTLSPELRFTRWFDTNFSNGDYNGTNLKQVQIFLSIRL